MVSSADYRSTRLTQDSLVGVKCKRKRRWRSSHVRTASVLWVGVVVADQVELQAVRDRGAVNALKVVTTAIRRCYLALASSPAACQRWLVFSGLA